MVRRGIGTLTLLIILLAGAGSALAQVPNLTPYDELPAGACNITDGTIAVTDRQVTDQTMANQPRLCADANTAQQAGGATEIDTPITSPAAHTHPAARWAKPWSKNG